MPRLSGLLFRGGLQRVSVLDWYRMRVIRLLCLASLLALVVFSGAVEPGALAYVSGVEELHITTEVEDQTR